MSQLPLPGASGDEPLEHTCHARLCTVAVPPEMLMCKRHWLSVPKKIREAVWATYRPGQCDDKRPSEQWHRAADAAIAHVAFLEKAAVRTGEVQAYRSFGFEPF